MIRPKILEAVTNRVDNAEPGTVFIPSDFFDIAEAVKVNMCLNRLVENGGLNRVLRGVYVKPRFSTLLNASVPPRSDDIARALARNFGWTIVPFGDTALNVLGLSTQVPSVWRYVSDGPYKKYNANGASLSFLHTDNKNEIISVSYKTAITIQALKALGKNSISDRDIHKLSTLFTQEEKQKMLFESQRITAWVYEHIKNICKEES